MKPNKITHKIFIIAAVAVVIALAVFTYFRFSSPEQVQGQLVFNRTFDNGAKVNKILIDSVNGSIELNQKDGYWRIGNYDNYYADFTAVKQFMDMLNSSIYVMEVPPAQDQKDNVALQDPLKQKEFAGFLVRTYAGDKELDAVIIGLRASEKGYFFARRQDSDKVWVISWNNEIPSVAQDWLPSSIMDIPTSAVQSLSIDNRSLTRQVSMQGFTDRFGAVIDINWLLYNLTSFAIDDIMSQKEFAKKYPDTDIKKIYDITTFYGLVFEIIFYDTGNDEAWVSIKLLADTLPKAAVYDYIKDNSFLYEDWYFSVSARQKDFLLNYNLF